MRKKLTPKQEAFCLAYIETGNASEAYRRAYACSKMKPETVNNKAHAMLKKGEIGARLDELRAPAVERAQVSLETHLNDLKRLRDVSAKKGKYGPAIQAEIARGKASGLYIERKEHTGKDGGPIQVADADVELTREQLIELAKERGLPTSIFDV
ncbi:MAG TPA: terminase small subunit [Pseudomonas sp.]|uniref:terminase small subunit n=1 Tax=Pseudomonas sp. TaxID=306 RepID=UPI002C8046D1|nr:terminase small subunit [Pseudomonas sp.]HWH86174.1 terminase small subunit [Pseudomonas sp.]